MKFKVGQLVNLTDKNNDRFVITAIKNKPKGITIRSYLTRKEDSTIFFIKEEDFEKVIPDYKERYKDLLGEL